jgi:acyl carrier protein
MDRKKIEKEFKEILSDRLNKQVTEIKLDSRLREDLNMDSFSAIEVMYEIEDKFNIEIEDKDLVNLKTVDAAISFIISKIKNNDVQETNK